MYSTATTRTPFRRPILLTVACLVIAPQAVPAEPAVQGRRERIAALSVLKVWGTPEEMGFAHGYLLADAVMDQARAEIKALPVPPAVFETQRRLLLRGIRISDRARAELTGMLAGIRAARKDDTKLAGLGRNLALADLLWLNAGDAMRGFLCSGFTVWGDRAKGAGVIVGRNFDYPLVPHMQLDRQMILVRFPDGRRPVATVTWPGYIGAFTGINDAGVCAFMHDGTGPTTTTPTKTCEPLALVLAELLETSDAGQCRQHAEKALASLAPYPFSYMVRIAHPRVKQDGMPGAPPAAIFRVDAGGFGRNPVGDNHCVTTNHYLSRDFIPAVNAAGDSTWRYTTLHEHLERGIDVSGAWAALHSVSVSGETFGTLHALVVLPEEREAHFGFAALDQGTVRSATARRPIRIEFDKLFDRN